MVHHRCPAVKTVLAAKRRFPQNRSLRLPPAVNYADVRIELEALSDGCWGVQAGSATILYPIQRYILQGEKRVHIYLFSSATGLNPVSRLTHQIDSKLGSLSLAVKETTKAFSILGNFNIQIQPKLTSDSQTSLSLCCKASVQLDIETALVVSRVQEVFGYQNLFYAPGQLFDQNVDLLTRYKPNLLELIPRQFYEPDFLKEEIEDRPTTKLSVMQKLEKLPHLCTKEMLWTRMKGSILPANLLERAPSTSNPPSSYSSTGTWGLNRKELCVAPCLPCGSATKKDCHMLDEKLLLEAQQKKHGWPKTLVEKECPVNFSGAELNEPAPAHRLIRVAKSARAGLTDRRPPAANSNIWLSLLTRRRGDLFAAKVLQRIITLF